MKYVARAILLSLLLVGIVTVLPTESQPQPVQAQQSDKYDGDCTGHETAGRCADKCPNPTDTLLDYDDVTGAAICRAAPTGCPYGDSIPLGPECDKHATENVTPAQPEVVDFGGK